MKILFLGGGNMANALIGGMVKQGFVASDIQVIDPGAEARSRLAAAYAVNCVETAEMADAADLIVLAVKPQQMRAALASLPAGDAKPLIVSIAAGLLVDDLARWMSGAKSSSRCTVPPDASSAVFGKP